MASATNLSTWLGNLHMAILLFALQILENLGGIL